MNLCSNRNSSTSRRHYRLPLYLGLLLGLTIMLAACGESAEIANVPLPIPTVTPLPGMTDPVQPTPTATAKPPAAQPSPVAQPVNAKPAQRQAVGPIPVVEGIIEKVDIENNLSVLTVNKTRYTIIPEITSRIGKWFKVGSRIKMSGTQYNDGTNLITLVVNVEMPQVAQPKPPVNDPPVKEERKNKEDKDKKADKDKGDDDDD